MSGSLQFAKPPKLQRTPENLSPYWCLLVFEKTFRWILCWACLELKDAILVLVDRFSKMAHLMPCRKTYDALKVAQMFFNGIVRLHDLPKTIISYWDVKFQNYFWMELWRMFDTNLNSQRSYCSDRNKQWDLYPFQVEFAYNNMHNGSTRKFHLK